MRQVFSQKLAVELVGQGFKIIKLGKNRKNEKLDTYFFEDSAALAQAILEYKSRNSKGETKNEDEQHK